MSEHVIPANCRAKESVFVTRRSDADIIDAEIALCARRPRDRGLAGKWTAILLPGRIGDRICMESCRHNSGFKRRR